MAAPQRVPPEAVRPRVHDGDALLVCAYDDREKCASLALEDAIPYPEFKEKEPEIDRRREIIFYCA